MSRPIQILGLSGSLRRASANTALLRAAAELCPEGAELLIHDYSGVPLFNLDADDDPAVEALREAIRVADGVLIATPEYNYSIPGVLKNALDWASRPAYRSPFAGKPSGVISAAGSFVGGARAQQHLKAVLLGMGTPVFPRAELLVGASHTKVDQGALTDEATRRRLGEYLLDFIDWVRR